LFDVAVMNTVFPLSEAEGVYVKLNGETVDDVCVTVPPPFSVTVTLVAVPPNVFPSTITGVVPHVLPDVALRVIVGGLMQPHETAKIPVVVTQPAAFLTPTKWFPLATDENTLLAWYGPPSILYSNPAPSGVVIVIIAWPKPPEQSNGANSGVPGAGGLAAITTLADEPETQPEAFVTVNV
jgi:hypothetical protein